jgi:hypothetical protein
MRKALLLALAVMLTFSLASAQTAKLVFGVLDGDDAGLIDADTNEVLDVELWIRTAPEINIVGIHIPLSTDDLLIQPDSRDTEDCELFYPIIPSWEDGPWDDVSFLEANVDEQHEGYTNMSILGIKDLVGDPDPDDGINTGGEWWHIATYDMTTAGEGDGTPHDDAFISGWQQDNGGLVLADFETGEMDNDLVELSFSPLQLPDTYVGIDDEIDVPVTYSLAQNYPNPFNASTTIKYTLPNEGYVTIDVFDIMGRRIETLVSNHQSAGSHSVTWNAESVSSGIYLYRIQAGDYTESKRCNLIK